MAKEWQEMKECKKVNVFKDFGEGEEEIVMRSMMFYVKGSMK